MHNIDNDVYVIHEGFLEGFKISEYYGISMVQNPRMFISTYEQDMGDIDIGADVYLHDKAFIKDMPKYMTSLNMGSGWACFPHEPKAILNSNLEEISLSAKVNPAVKADKKRQKRKGVFMNMRMNKNTVSMQ